MSDTEAMADAAYDEYGALLQRAGVDAGLEYGAIMKTKANLAAQMEQITSALADLDADEYMPEAVRLQRMRDLKDMGELLVQASERQLNQWWAEHEATLERAAMSDLVRDEPAEEVLIRQELDRYLAAATKQPEQVLGVPYRPGQTVKEALLALIRSNPRYAATVAGDYGRMLLSPADHAELTKLARLTMPGTTPKAQAARAALAGLKQAKGHTVGLTFAARQKLSAALTPKPAQPGRYRPDTIIPRRG